MFLNWWPQTHSYMRLFLSWQPQTFTYNQLFRSYRETLPNWKLKADRQTPQVSCVNSVHKIISILISILIPFVDHIRCSLFTICGDTSPFHASMMRPASQAGPMHETAGVRKLINAALLSLINEACVNVCCATLLSSELVDPLVCRRDRVTREAGGVGLVARNRGRRGYWVTLYPYIYTAGFYYQCFSRCLLQAYMAAGCTATQHTSHRRLGPNVSGACGQGL